jgi:hypothetical protein
MQRSRLKKKLKAERAARRPESGKKGFRVIITDDERYIFRIARKSVDIRRQSDGKKIVVKGWELFGLSQDEWEEKRWQTLCGIPECTCGVEPVQFYTIRPGIIREYLTKENRFDG